MKGCKLLILRGLSEHKQSTTGAFDVFPTSVSLLHRSYIEGCCAGRATSYQQSTATVTLGGNTEIKVVRRGQQFVIERDTDHYRSRTANDGERQGEIMISKVRPAKCSLWLAKFTLVFAVVLSPNSRASAENPLLSKEQIQVYKDFLNSYPSKAGVIDIPRNTAVFDDAPTDPCTQRLILEVRPETHLLPSNIIGENERFRIVDTELKSSIAHHHNLLRLSEIVFDVPHQHAVLRFDYYCGILCGQGDTVVLQKLYGRWKQVRSCTNWMS